MLNSTEKTFTSATLLQVIIINYSNSLKSSNEQVMRNLKKETKE